MRREVSDRTILDKFVTEFCRVLEKHVKYAIVSGFVAIAHGRARGTEDIDIIIEKLDKQGFKKLHGDLKKHVFICMQSDNTDDLYDEYLSEFSSIRYTWKDRPLPEIELKLAKDKLDYMQIQERIKYPMTGLDVWFSSIESNIAFKEEYLKSDKDIEDANYLRIIYEGKLNAEKIRQIKRLIRQMRMK
jgi:hypothetical protein